MSFGDWGRWVRGQPAFPGVCGACPEVPIDFGFESADFSQRLQWGSSALRAAWASRPPLPRQPFSRSSSSASAPRAAVSVTFQPTRRAPGPAAVSRGKLPTRTPRARGPPRPLDVTMDQAAAVARPSVNDRSPAGSCEVFELDGGDGAMHECTGGKSVETGANPQAGPASIGLGVNRRSCRTANKLPRSRRRSPCHSCTLCHTGTP